MICKYCFQPIIGSRRSWCDATRYELYRRTVDTEPFLCPGCDRVVLVPRHNRTLRKFCSRSCATATYNRLYLRGPRNGMWRGGRAYNYGPGWKEAKERVRERDKVCQNCAKTPEENGRALDVHHIDPHRNSKNNSLDNLVALCHSCHMRALDRGRRGAARFCGPEQLELKPLSQREQIRIRGYRQRRRREELKAEAFELDAKGQSLRQISRALGVSHQTISNWLTGRH